MLERIENFMDKLFPNLSKDAKDREQKTIEIVEKSHEARKNSEDNLFAAYRQVGILTSRRGHPRRWD